ncbi:MAG: hypothetical protein RIR26_1053 [Pseudomonadota bacterium]
MLSLEPVPAQHWVQGARTAIEVVLPVPVEIAAAVEIAKTVALALALVLARELAVAVDFAVEFELGAGPVEVVGVVYPHCLQMFPAMGLAPKAVQVPRMSLVQELVWAWSHLWLVHPAD